jgi:hypothetical protein
MPQAKDCRGLLLNVHATNENGVAATALGTIWSEGPTSWGADRLQASVGKVFDEFDDALTWVTDMHGERMPCGVCAERPGKMYAGGEYISCPGCTPGYGDVWDSYKFEVPGDTTKAEK